MHRTSAPNASAELSQQKAELPSAFTYALQPIVDIHSGAVYAYEALLRGTDAAGFATIDSFFDESHAAGRLWTMEQSLHQLALATFRRLPETGDRKIFLNIDNRVFADPEFCPETIAHTARKLGVSPSQVTVEFSEKHAATTSDCAVDLTIRLRRSGLRIALDDFGQGYSELKLLYDAAPEYVKIDRFYVADMATSPRKHLFVSTIASLAHVLGARVVAEGVETETEFVACREAGCDLVQGWFISRPLRDLSATPSVYLLPAPDAADDATLARPRLDAIGCQSIEGIGYEATADQLIDRFATEPDIEAVPVIGSDGTPVGVVTERALWAELYHRYTAGEVSAQSLALAPLTRKVPVIEADEFPDVFDERRDGLRDGIVITRSGRYAGYVPPAALSCLITERRLSQARDQNPLSRLPGNATINNHLLWLGRQTDEERVCCYFDFNHFKPFNDTYGFRLGDRAIILFAEILKRRFDPSGAFLGHVGGDDFFAAFTGTDIEEVERGVDAVLADFRDRVEDYYDPADRENGYLIADDRGGQPQIYPLMTCSAAVLILPRGETIETLDAFSRATAAAKRAAKLAPSGRISRCLGRSDQPR